MKKLLFVLSVAVCCLFVHALSDAAEIAEAAAEPQTITIKAATANPLQSLHVLAIEKFAEIVERETGGRIRFRRYYNGVLGDEQENVRQLRTAEIHLSVLSCGNLTPFAPSAGVRP